MGSGTQTYSSAAWPRAPIERSLTPVLLSIWLLVASPTSLFLLALAAMLLRHPDVPFFEVDRVAFVLLVLGVLGNAAIRGESVWRMERASWPMLALTALAVVSVAGQPFDHPTWSLLAAKFIVPFTLFHLAGLTFRNEASFRAFELFLLLVLAVVIAATALF